MTIKKNLIAAFLLFSSLTIKAQNRHPNVIFFLVDDLGWNDIQLNGSELYETPNINALAKESVYFNNAYSSYPRCVPSRFSMITGQHPARNGKKDGVPKLFKTKTIAETMKANGYGTFFAGKWHLGHEESSWPHHKGFDINKGGCDAGAPASYFFPYHDSSKSKNNQPYYGLEKGEEGEYITDRLTSETIKYIEENAPSETGKPFFIYLAHYAVHTPLQAKAERISYYQEKIKKLSFDGAPYIFGPDGRAKMWQDNAIYAAMVESVDQSLGRLINTLKERDLYDNTIIIFTSDHGGLSNSGLKNKRELATTNKPLRAGKGHNYEGGIKVPVLVRWPGVTNGKTTESIITGMDYYPSILEMCGLPLCPNAHLDGVSFAPALKGNPINTQRAFYWHQIASRPKSTGDHNSSVIRIANYKLHHFLDDNKIELYNLKHDPFEKNNIAPLFPQVVKQMKQQLEDWKIAIDAAAPKSPKRGNSRK
ncbi:sulfatase [Sunxiuqinia elliptica]|uniref:Arylsulfatase A-like enzyme n=1 Tax=Sunxiuqinia elliptica TaxID=655355 RepID=A0A4R6GNR7_9BACT|nr:sulfatase [Sunxiuqinia elliptica]TDN96637.1 arylsulfatase A-like enzyme [Sunxiuqinia elliptica]TDO55804.1 arylsulfatase A-like enzyme [Sunxiuqinia elliptica]